MTPGELEDRLLSRLQGDGLPLSPVPYADLAEELEVSEEEVLQAMERLIGSVWCVSSAALSMRRRSACRECSVLSPRRRSASRRRGARDAHPEVTHDYQREGDYALWFTLNAGSSGELDRIITEIEAETACTVALRLPSQEVWKLRTDFRLPGSRS
jgi:DNA-binding Lrp family transcriptional regulator